MTIRKKMEEDLINHGLWPDEAVIILNNARESKVLESMEERWEEDTGGYPTQLLAAVWMSIKPIALDWIKTNKPQHFARFMLEQN